MVNLLCKTKGIITNVIDKRVFIYNLSFRVLFFFYISHQTPLQIAMKIKRPDIALAIHTHRCA